MRYPAAGRLEVAQHEEGRYGPYLPYNVGFHSYDKVLEKLTFEDDRELVKKAIELVASSAVQ